MTNEENLFKCVKCGKMCTPDESNEKDYKKLTCKCNDCMMKELFS